MTPQFAKAIAEFDWLAERGFQRRQVDTRQFEFVGPDYTIRLTDDTFSTTIEVGSARLEWTSFGWVAKILCRDEVPESSPYDSQAEQTRCLKAHFGMIDDVLRNGDVDALTAEVTRQANTYHAEISARAAALRK